MIFNILEKLIKIKIELRRPKNKKVLIYDRLTERTGFAEALFKKKDYEVLDVRYERINLYVFFDTFLKTGLNNIKHNYKVNFIKTVSPKIVYTSVDNNLSFFRLKHFIKKPIYISDQNGISKTPYASSKQRLKKDFYWECNKFNRDNKKKLQADIIFLFGDNEKKKMQRIINGKFYTLGNTNNNHYVYKNRKKKNSKIKSIMFICSGIYKASIDHEKLIFKHLNLFCNKNYIKLFLCGRLDASKENFYRKNYEAGSWKYLPKISTENSYKNLNDQELIVFTHSSLGFEALAKGIKVAAFYSNFPEKSSSYLYKKKGFFWSNTTNYKDFEKLLEKVIKCSNLRWKRNVKKYSSEILKYDPYNKEKKKIIYSNLKS